jgi:hypothetical protein
VEKRKTRKPGLIGLIPGIAASKCGRRAPEFAPAEEEMGSFAFFWSHHPDGKSVNRILLPPDNRQIEL